MLTSTMNKYCINIDWFEVFTYEPTDCTGQAWYEALGYVVAPRDYGTRVFREMFTLIGKDGQPWLEVRRDPYSKKSQGGILDDRSCILRLVNRACYDWFPVQDLYQFLSDLGFHYRKYELCSVKRADICVDFREDALTVHGSNIMCDEFIRQYMAGDYWKIGAAKCQAFGEEFSKGMKFHALKFGSPTSMVNTKLYNKTLEMAQVKVKPYIIDAWVNAGLLENDQDVSQIWRLEFSITSNTDEWIVETKSPGQENFYQSNSLSAWANTANYPRFLRGLCKQYFTFAYKTCGVSKYKCERFIPISIPADVSYKPIHVRPERQISGKTERILCNKLMQIRDNGNIPKQYEQALNCSLWLLNTLYANHAISHTDEQDGEVFNKMMQDYNEEMIRRAFDNIIASEQYPKQSRDIAQLCWALWNRPLTTFVRSLAVKEPYSITAVRFLESDIPPEETIARKHLLRACEREGINPETLEPDIPDREWMKAIAEKWGLDLSRSDT